MGGTYISPNPKRTKELIDPDGNVLDSLETKNIIKLAEAPVAPPPNLEEILAIKQKRLETIPEDELAINALEKMREHDITQLLVLRDKQYIGIIHLHDLIREGII